MAELKKVSEYSKDYIVYKHVQSEIDTVENFLNQDGLSIAYHYYAYGLFKDFLDYKGDTNKSNAERILERYNKEEYSQWKTSIFSIENNGINLFGNISLGGDTPILANAFSTLISSSQPSETEIQQQAKLLLNPPLKVGTKLLIPKNIIQTSSLVYTSNTNTVQEGNYVDFINQKDTYKSKNGITYKVSRHPMVDIYETGLYNKVSSNGYGDFKGGVVNEEYPNATVYLWCRSINKKFKISNQNLEGSFIDVTDYVNSITTQSTINSGGGFTLSLSPVYCVFDNDSDRWILKDGSLIKFQEEGLERNTHISEGNINYLDSNGNWKESNYYFYLTINSNDLVFIKFETLEIEKFERTKEDNKESFIIPKSAIGGTWEERDPKNQKEYEKGVNKKILAPTAIYDMIGMIDKVSKTESSENANVNIEISGRDLSKALYEDGCYFHPLEYSGDMFGGVDVAQEDNGPLANRIFGKIEDLFVYSNRSVLNSIMFIRNYISSVGYVPNSVFSNYEEKAKKWVISKSNGDFSEDNADGIWQIWKFIFDDSIADRRIVDSSISTDSGPIANFISKVAQSPFIEFFSDTYLDRYYSIFRKPPFDREGYSKLAKFAKKHLRIKAEDIASTDDLSFSDDEVYSWYKLIPQGLFLGEGSEISLAFLPAIKFDEYAEIWGSNPLSVVSNLVEYESYKKDVEQGQTYLEKQVYRDLKFMIDTTCYLPFTRSGTIELINGHRNIKKGMCIYLETTNEVFYVSGVINEYSTDTNMVNRKTILQVERGMVYDFIEGIDLSTNYKSEAGGIEEGIDKEYAEIAREYGFDINSSLLSGAESFGSKETVKTSYFDIINTTLNFGKYTKDGYVDRRLLQNWKVNKDVFNFFLQKKQFSEEYKDNK